MKRNCAKPTFNNSKIKINLFLERGTRDVGFLNEYRDFVEIQEKIPELIVPDLTNFPLKAYVTYKLGNDEVEQPEFTPLELFNKVYAPKIISDFENDGLHEDGQPKSPSEDELMTSKQAKNNASKTGCDLFTDGDLRPSWLY